MKIKFAFFGLVLLAFCACKKGPGVGGTSSIKGKVFNRNYNLDFSAIIDSGFATEATVYLIYGDDITYSDNQKTSYDGTFDFKYLRKGKYTVFTYESDSTRRYLTKSPDVAVKRDVEIKSNKSEEDTGIIIVNKNK